LCQFSYWPASAAKACKSRREAAYSALLRLPMGSVLPVMTAELLQFQLLRHGLLVLRRGVVPTFALGTLKRDDFSACARHVLATPLVTFWMEPSTRVELVTPSLP